VHGFFLSFYKAVQAPAITTASPISRKKEGSRKEHCSAKGHFSKATQDALASMFSALFF
jgi:hypothetical protein